MGLRRLAGVCFLFFLNISVSLSFPQSILQYLPKTYGSLSADDFSVHRKNIPGDYRFCDSWMYAVEVSNAVNWTQILPRCVQHVNEYMTGKRYLSDCEAVNYYALEFATSVEVSGDGKDAWIFDDDETLISNIKYFLEHGTKPNGKQLEDDDWYSPAIPSSLKLFNELKKLKFKIFLLTGRDESYRDGTIINLNHVGYENWNRLIMRGPEDEGTLATVYKSKKRKELEDEGYRIRGSSGDQWSDLNGYSVAERSFKMPNPMYYAA